MITFAIRANAYGSLEADIVRVYELPFDEPWEALAQFAEAIKHEYPGWDRYRKIDLTLEKVS